MLFRSHAELIPVVINNFFVGRYQLRHSLGLYNQSERCARALYVEVVVDIARLEV